MTPIVERKELPAFGCVAEPWWDDRPLAIVGTGPSLAGFDFNRLDLPDVRILAVKEAIWDLPFAAAVFSLDRPWINRMAERLAAIDVPKVFSVEKELGVIAHIDGALYLDRQRFEGLSDKPSVIQSGGNSGFGAFNYAYLKRAGRNGHPIVLFGFDYCDAGDRHHHRPEQYHWYTPRQNSRYWQNWGDNFLGCKKQLDASGTVVINASPISTVRAFPKVTIDEGLRHLSRF